MSPILSRDEIRTRFSRAMSDMYRNEVPQYGQLLELVADINQRTLQARPALHAQMQAGRELERLGVERHGAIRVGTAAELSMLRRLFAVMGMEPVGYYDLSVAGVPVHSTAFRPVSEAALRANPFRVFTSLLRLELIADPALQDRARAILGARSIFTPHVLELIAKAESAGGLHEAEADAFVKEALETFRWHCESTVDAATYASLHQAHRLIADVVCFKGPHINHLTPRTLDIDAAQAAMPAHGMHAKEEIEGPPARACPILLRQTSFKALEEAVRFADQGRGEAGSHTARFGEIEQRGVALTPEGRALYDRLLAQAREPREDTHGRALSYGQRLHAAFADFPDDWQALRRQKLAFFRYVLSPAGEQQIEARSRFASAGGLEQWIEEGLVSAEPITYEDFLPVSAAGIFQSNLGGETHKQYAAHAARQAFEADLGASVHDEMALYAAAQQQSMELLLSRVQG
ncbi:2-oxoadipate dioxygenase/decarboxylase HglS [Comamonas composti]|uniref:2-oxoadipate dioxygenase/decarboxylase HglS n=1 Tax=Comamonas composti TaxID=408558 RepID=UPI00042617CB|nr:DUF1338 family protein [Comamonas composti]